MELSELELHCDSPIERRLAKALAAVLSDVESAGMKVLALPPMQYEITSQLPTGAFAFLIPQARIDGCETTFDDDGSDWSYRIDFLFVVGPRPAFRKAIAIECDGHEWHEKTKEQVARDKRRDRRLLADGIPSVRFSGAEIHANAEECAEYLRGLAHFLLGDVLGNARTAERLRALENERGVR